MYYFGGTSKQPKSPVKSSPKSPSKQPKSPSKTTAKPTREQPKRKSKASPTSPKAPPPKRQQYTPVRPGQVETSRNRQLALTGDAYKNELSVLAYNDSTLGTDKIIQNMMQQIPDLKIGTISGKTSDQFNIQSGNLGFVFYDEPDRDPSEPGYTPSVTSQEEALSVFYFTPSTPFTEKKKHQCLGILYNGRRLKIKKIGLNPGTNMPFLYVEDPVFGDKGKTAQQTKWYGVFTIKEMESPAAQDTVQDPDQELMDFFSFGKKRNKMNKMNKRNKMNKMNKINKINKMNGVLENEIRYLKNLKC